MKEKTILPVAALMILTVVPAGRLAKVTRNRPSPFVMVCPISPGSARLRPATVKISKVFANGRSGGLSEYAKRQCCLAQRSSFGLLTVFFITVVVRKGKAAHCG